jgi:RNA polymerase sigma-70 factor (ECF subfamily)
MAEATGSEAGLAERARAGDAAALAALFQRHGPRLRALVRLRMDPRLRGRLDESDVLQESWLDCQRRFEEWRTGSDLPAFLWLRLLAAQKLAEMHRRHLGTAARDAGRERREAAGPPAHASSMADRLAADLTSPSQAAARAEETGRVLAALEGLDETDREVLALRHFEELTNDQVAAVLGITKAGASNRYIRALRRLRAALGDRPGPGSGA